MAIFVTFFKEGTGQCRFVFFTCVIVACFMVCSYVRDVTAQSLDDIGAELERITKRIEELEREKKGGSGIFAFG